MCGWQVQKATEIATDYRYMSNLGLCTCSHIIKFPILCCLVMKLRIVNVDTKAKVLLKFGSLETLCVDMT